MMVSGAPPANHDMHPEMTATLGPRWLYSHQRTLLLLCLAQCPRQSHDQRYLQTQGVVYMEKQNHGGSSHGPISPVKISIFCYFIFYIYTNGHAGVVTRVFLNDYINQGNR